MRFLIVIHCLGISILNVSVFARAHTALTPPGQPQCKSAGAAQLSLGNGLLPRKLWPLGSVAPPAPFDEGLSLDPLSKEAPARADLFAATGLLYADSCPSEGPAGLPGAHQALPGPPESLLDEHSCSDGEVGWDRLMAAACDASASLGAAACSCAPSDVAQHGTTLCSNAETPLPAPSAASVAFGCATARALPGASALPKADPELGRAVQGPVHPRPAAAPAAAGNAAAAGRASGAAASSAALGAVRRAGPGPSPGAPRLVGGTAAEKAAQGAGRQDGADGQERRRRGRPRRFDVSQLLQGAEQGWAAGRCFVCLG